MSMFRSNYFTYVCFCSSDRLYLAFSTLKMVCHPLEEKLPMKPHPLEITAFQPPSPSEFSVPFGGGNIAIFWNYTIYFCLKRLTNEANRSLQSKIHLFASFDCQTTNNCNNNYYGTSWTSQQESLHPGRFATAVIPCKLYDCMHKTTGLCANIKQLKNTFPPRLLNPLACSDSNM